MPMPDRPCRGDVFHALNEIIPVVTYLENRAYETIAVRHKLERKKASLQRQGRRKQTPQVQQLGRKVVLAAEAEAKAVALADDVALLTRWLRFDIFAVSGLCYADRCALFDFVLAELKARAHHCPHRITPVCTLLSTHRDLLLAFAAQLDRDLENLAAEFQVPVDIVRQLLDLQASARRPPLPGPQEPPIRQKIPP